MVSRIPGVSPGGVASRAKPAASRLGASFNVEREDVAPTVQENLPAQSVALSGMLALQETETGNVQDRTARRHGIALLQSLLQLQRALLTPQQDNGTEIETLTSLANEMPQASDPGLASALTQIRLRAKIELLRRGIEIT